MSEAPLKMYLYYKTTKNTVSTVNGSFLNRLTLMFLYVIFKESHVQKTKKKKKKDTTISGPSELNCLLFTTA